MKFEWSLKGKGSTCRTDGEELQGPARGHDCVLHKSFIFLAPWTEPHFSCPLAVSLSDHLAKRGPFVSPLRADSSAQRDGTAMGQIPNKAHPFFLVVVQSGRAPWGLGSLGGLPGQWLGWLV